MAKLVNNKSVLYKYLVSYMIILIIPLLILGSFLYNNAANALKTELETYTLDRMFRMKEVFEESVKKTAKIALKISQDHMLKQNIITKSEYESVLAIQQLSNYWDSTFVKYMLLYFNGEEYLYTPAGKLKLDTFLEYVIFQKSKDIINSQNTTSLQNMIEMLPYPIFTDVNSQTNKYLAFFYPIPYGSNYSSEPYGTLSFLIEGKVVFGILGDLLQNSEGTLFIENEKTGALFTLGNKNFIKEYDYINIMSNIQVEGLHNISYARMDLSILNVVSSETNIRFVLIMPLKNYLTEIVQTKRQVLSTILIVGLFGIVISLLLARLNYRPIKELFRSITKFSENNFSHKNYNEFEHIKYLYQDVMHNNEKLKNQFKIHKSFIREQILLTLLKGKISDKSKIIKMLELYELNFFYKYFFVSVILVHKDEDSRATISDLLFTINKMINESFSNNKCFSFEMINGEIAIIINTEYKNCEKIFIEKIFGNIQSVAFKEYGITLSIGVGKSYDDICNLRRSFIESLSALEYRFTVGQNKVLFFDELTRSDSKFFWNPIQQQARLAQCIKQGNLYYIEDLINEIIFSIQKRNISIGMTRIVCFGMIHTIIEILNELKIKCFEDEIENLAYFNCLDDFKEKINCIAIKICKHIDSKKESHNEELKIAILNCIDENYTNNLFSIALVAEKLNMSPKYLSRFFKQQFGITYIEYVKNLRINYAKTLLTNTNESIRDIVFKVGYNDTTSFNRLFKNIVGVPPGEYRKLAQE